VRDPQIAPAARERAETTPGLERTKSALDVLRLQLDDEIDILGLAKMAVLDHGQM
jgi:hypothetical protein